MESIPNALVRSMHDARERLGALSRSTAGDNATGSAGGSQVTLAGAAREAIFADALLAAAHSRLQALKNVAK